jgi:hypothetical protein
MKRLLVFPVLIFTCSILKASQNALAFEFVQGVIVDPTASVVYLMNPEGGSTQSAYPGGAVRAITRRGAKPLLPYDDTLLAQAEGKEGVAHRRQVSTPTPASGTRWGCMPVTQGIYNPSPLQVCGYIPTSCPIGQSIIASDADEGTWPNGSRKGNFGCSSTMPP